MKKHNKFNDIDELHNYLNKFSTPFLKNKKHKDQLEKQLDLAEKLIKDNLKSKEDKLPYFFNVRMLRYSLVTLSIALVFILGYIFLNNMISNKSMLNSSIASATGYSYLKDDKSGEIIKIENNLTLKAGYTVNTEKGANLNITISDKNIVKLNEDSKVKIVSLKEKNNNEIIEMYMTKGEAYYSVTLPTKKSIFKVYTDTSAFTVKGTLFSIKINKNKDATLKVLEGTVEISDFIKSTKLVNKIKTHDNEIYTKIKELENNKILVHKGNSKTIKKNEIDTLNNKLNGLITQINNKRKNNIKINKEEKNNIMAEITKMGNALAYSETSKPNNKISYKNKSVKIKTIEGSIFYGTLLTEKDEDMVILKTSLENLSISKKNIISITLQ